jgi:hypothetical protein
MGKMKEAALRQKDTSVMAPAKPKTAVAVVPAAGSNPYLEDAGDSLGVILKFNKGKWRLGDDTVPPGTKYVAYLPQALKGWVRFEGNKVTDRHLGKTADRYVPPDREELGDLDKSKWEIGADGKPRDPWSEQRYLPLLSADGTEILTFVSGSAGGKIAIQDLNRRFGYQAHTGKLPIVELATREYRHATFGLMESPKFEVVGWTSPAGEAPPAPTVGEEMSDEIPF